MSWPVTLPQSLMINGYNEQRFDGVLRGSYNGRPKLRNLYRNPPIKVTGTVFLTEEQVQTLETYYKDTLSNGITRFLWKRPTSLTNEYFQFTAPPAISPVSCDQFTANLEFLVFTNA